MYKRQEHRFPAPSSKLNTAVVEGRKPVLGICSSNLHRTFRTRSLCIRSRDRKPAKHITGCRQVKTLLQTLILCNLNFARPHGVSIGNLHITTRDYVPTDTSCAGLTVLTSRSDASNFQGVLGAPVGKAHHLCINYPSIDAEPYVVG